MRSITFLLRTLLFVTFVTLVTACSTGPAPRVPDSSVDAKTLRNPIKATPQSIASGKRLYDRLCADCHGVGGNGIIDAAETLGSAGEVRPPDLTDDNWEHGS